MPIVVQHQPSPTVLGNAAFQLGQYQSAAQAAEQRQGRALEAARLRLQQQQAQEQAMLNRQRLALRAQEAQAARQAQYARMQQQAQQAMLSQLGMNQRAQLAADVRREGWNQTMQRQMGRQEFTDERDQFKYLNDAVTQIQRLPEKTQLTDAGMAEHQKLVSSLAAIRRELPKMPLKQRNEALGKWLQQAEAANLESYSVQRQTPDQQWQQITRVDPETGMTWQLVHPRGTQFKPLPNPMREAEVKQKQADEKQQEAAWKDHFSKLQAWNTAVTKTAQDLYDRSHPAVKDANGIPQPQVVDAPAWNASLQQAMKMNGWWQPQPPHGARPDPWSSQQQAPPPQQAAPPPQPPIAPPQPAVVQQRPGQPQVREQQVQALTARVAELVAKAKSGQLTQQERDELQAIMSQGK